MDRMERLPDKEAVNDGAEKQRHGEDKGSMCPQCGKLKVFRSRRKNFLEKLRSRFGRYPFRCHACGHRFFKKLKHKKFSDRPNS